MRGSRCVALIVRMASIVSIASIVLIMSVVAACRRPSAPTIVADPSTNDAAPIDAAKTSVPDPRIGGVLECAPAAAGDVCTGLADFPLRCTYVGKTPEEEARLWDAVWRDGKHHGQFDALDAYGAMGATGAKSPRLADARCLRSGPDTDYNMFDWCCRAP